MLYLISGFIIDVFNARNEAAHLIEAFCIYVAFTYGFAGATFVGNASFNNLGKTWYSTLINFGKATLGTMPFVYFGALWADAEGVLIGQGVGSILFGFVSIGWAYFFIGKMKST